MYFDLASFARCVCVSRVCVASSVWSSCVRRVSFLPFSYRSYSILMPSVSVCVEQGEASKGKERQGERKLTPDVF